VAVFIFLAIGVWRWRWNPDIHAGVSFVINALSDAYVSSFANPDVLVTHLLGYGVVLIGYALLLLMPPILYTILMLVNTAGLALLLGTAPHLSPLEVLQKGGAFIIFFLAISPLLAWLRYAFAKSGEEEIRKFMSRRLKALLLDISRQSPLQQKAAIQWAMEAWRRDIEQTDDICVIGFGR
jgi:hypothetical protein